MTVGEKLRYLRSVEGALRQLGRDMTQLEVLRAMQRELKRTLSQSYLSQIESGARPHLTNRTRSLLARFFKVHPGYLVDDPPGYHTELASHLRLHEDKLDLWLIDGSERFRRDGELREALVKLARHRETRKCLILLGAIVDTPNLVERLSEVLRPAAAAASAGGVNARGVRR